MSGFLIGLLMTFLIYALLLLCAFALVVFLPASFLGTPAKAVVKWLPPFMGGEALRNWAATMSERAARKRLAGKPTGATAGQLATEIEEIAMHAMLPMAGNPDLERVVACPKEGQGMVGVTAPEVLQIADYIRKNKPPGEQKRIHDMAVENTRKLTFHAAATAELHPPPCPLQGKDHVCSVYANRPLRCRPLHLLAIAKTAGLGVAKAAGPEGGSAHGQTVAEGIETGLTQALKSAGVDAGVYELNSALATALETPDAAERWAKGEKVFHDPLSLHWSSAAGRRTIGAGS
ncbi:MAG: hypothetical protein ABI318_20195 [Chthoniobacteraceae bacterium]